MQGHGLCRALYYSFLQVDESLTLDKLFKTKNCVFALEVFPPKKESPVESVYGMLRQLGQLPADYISVTYSAGGTGAREYTAQIAGYLKRELGVEPLAHLTGLYNTQSGVLAELKALREAGVKNVLALRGDRAPGAPEQGGFAHASDLLACIAAEGGFYTVGACYPEGHPESAGLAEDIARLHHKLEAGAGHLVTQLFFDNNKYFRFLNLARKHGVNCPIEAGVMPIVRYEQLARTVSLSSASLPSGFTRWVSRWAHSPEDFFEAGIDYAVSQIRDLIESGADGIHLYAMNNPVVARRVYDGVADLL